MMLELENQPKKIKPFQQDTAPTLEPSPQPEEAACPKRLRMVVMTPKISYPVLKSYKPKNIFKENKTLTPE